jgi:glycosyltransferase involved in cell wall biosynthesis
MRIAQIPPLYESIPPKLYGGTERVVSYLTEELVTQGHEVTLFGTKDSVTSASLYTVCDQATRLNPGCKDPLAWHIYQLQLVMENAGEFDIIHFHNDYLHFPLSSTGITDISLHYMADWILKTLNPFIKNSLIYLLSQFQIINVNHYLT